MNNTNNYCKSYFYGLESEISKIISSNNFDIPASKLHYTPAHAIEPEHVKIELEFDFEKEVVRGRTTYNLVVKSKSIDKISLDAKNLFIQETFVNKTKVEFENTNKKLNISLPESFGRGTKLELTIIHSVEKPAAGVYFVKPSKDYPSKHLHVWTQCQDEDASFFIPSFDHPSFKQTSEVIINNVPDGMMALSNGTLVNKTDSTFHYKFDVPHSIYLVSIVVGNFQEIQDSWDRIPVSFFVHPSRVDDGHRSFDKTKKMVQFFSEFIGVRYPYEKYSQIAVSDFIFGGMENTSVTTQTDLTLHDERAHIDFSSDPLVAHELAHQWFGDLLTCKEWAHAWLNESFATYFQALFMEYDLGKDEFDYQMLTNAETYFNEDSTKYRRSIVYHKYVEPIDLFDSHLYPGGSWRLHMLRQRFGTDEFKRAINYYVEKNKFKSVETIDLQRAFEIVTGNNVDSFFDQWLYKAGYPIIEFEYEWQLKKNLLKMVVKQTQNIEESQLFTFDTKIKIVFEDQSYKILPVRIEEREQSFYVYTELKPLYVSFDYQNAILKLLTIKAKPEFKKNQIIYDSEIISGIYAVQALVKDNSYETIKFLGSQLQNDNFWGVHSRIAEALGSIGGPLAESYLIEALSLPHPKARRAVVKALGQFTRSSKSVEALTNILTTGDKSYFVEAEACRSLGLLKINSVVEILRKQLTKESHMDTIRQGVLEGLSTIQSEESLEILVEWIKIGKPTQARTTAIISLAKLGKLLRPELAIEELSLLSKEPNFRVKMATIAGFKILATKKSLEILSKMYDSEADGRFKMATYKTKLAIEKELERSQELDILKEEISKLKEENKSIKDSISKLQPN